MRPNQQISGDDWRTVVWLCHLLGFFGVHRFYTGKIVSGILYLLTFGFGLVGVTIDLLMLYSGNFTDSRGRLILTDSQMLLYQEGFNAAGFSAAGESTQNQKDTISMNHISPDDLDRIRSASYYTAAGFEYENGEIVNAALYIVRDGKIRSQLHYVPGKSYKNDFFSYIDRTKLLVCFGLRENFSAFAKVLSGISGSATWDYIDLREVCKARGVLFQAGETCDEMVSATVSCFEGCRS